jgi:hypothetical protein
MLKRTITYEDFNGDTVTDIAYFNLSKAELLEMEVGEGASFAQSLKNLTMTRKPDDLVREFKKFILISYGIKSEDGKKFTKSNAIREEFEQTAAYQTLFMELASSEDEVVKFIKGILPKDMESSLDQTFKEIANTPELPPPPAAA